MLADQQWFYDETGTHFIPTPAKYKTSAPFLKEVDNQALIQERNRLSQAFPGVLQEPGKLRVSPLQAEKGRTGFLHRL